MEQRIELLYEILGLHYEPADLTKDELLAQYRMMLDAADENKPDVTINKAVHLARKVYWVNEAQLYTISQLTQDRSPWVAYEKALERATRDVKKIGGQAAEVALSYLIASARHIRNVAFQFVHTYRSFYRAERLVEQYGDELDEAIASIVVSLRDIYTPARSKNKEFRE